MHFPMLLIYCYYTVNVLKYVFKNVLTNKKNLIMIIFLGHIAQLYTTILSSLLYFYIKILSRKHLVLPVEHQEQKFV